MTRLRSRRHSVPWLSAALSAAALGACVPIEPLPGTGATSELRGVDFVPVPDVPLYCYRTLADVDCYATVAPLPPNRLILPYPPDHQL